VRTLLQLMAGLVVLGLAGGWLLRSRLPRRHLTWVVVGAFLPLPVHAAYVTVWAHRSGVDTAWLALYAGACLSVAVAGWWWTRRTAATRPFRAPLGLPVAATVQVILTQLVGNAARPAGVILNPLPGVALFAASIALAATLLVLLPPPNSRPIGERGPAWWRALGRLGRR
jgi:hypothetical protein